MKNIIVHSAQSIMNVAPKVPHIIISISDKEDSLPPIKGNELCHGILRLCFHDVDRVISGSKRDGSFYEYNPISDEQAQKAADFTLNYVDNVDTIICQCDAGVSRSAGMAAAIAKAFNSSDEEYFAPTTPYIPNRVVYRKVLQRLTS